MGIDELQNRPLCITKIAREYGISTATARMRLRRARQKPTIKGKAHVWDRAIVDKVFEESPSERRWDCAGYQKCLEKVAKDNGATIPCLGCHNYRFGLGNLPD